MGDRGPGPPGGLEIAAQALDVGAADSEQGQLVAVAPGGERPPAGTKAPSSLYPGTPYRRFFAPWQLLPQRDPAARIDHFGMATPNSQPPVGAGQVTGHVRLEHVSFAYPAADRPPVTGIDLDVPAGSTLALAGETGPARRP